MTFQYPQNATYAIAGRSVWPRVGIIMKFSAGLLPFRRLSEATEVFLVHMGGPIWEHRHESWSLAKGEYDPATEDPREVAAREFLEEVGLPAPQGQWVDLGDVFMSRANKTVRTYAVETDEDLAFVSSNLFDLEWPPKSGQIQQFPETDDAGWFSLDFAQERILRGQLPIVELIRRHIDAL